MKISRILLVVAITFGMMACNNENEPQVIDGPEATISVKVFPSSNSPGLRSVGDLSDSIATASPGLTAESAIHQLEVWVFSGDVLTGYKSAAGAEVIGVEALAGASTVVVVANANIGIKASKADLLDEVKELPAEDIATGLVMTSGEVNVTLEAGQNQFGYPETTGINNLSTALLPIVRVNARVALVSATVNYDAVPPTQQAVFDKLRDVEVAMFNVPNKTNLFGNSLAINGDFQFGAKWESLDGAYVGANDSGSTANTILWDEVVDANALPIVKTKAPFYYVNENTSTTAGQEMFIVMRAKVYKGNDVVLNLEDLYTDAEGYTYYPVWVNVDKSGYSYAEGYVADGKVLRNTQYNISLTLKGLGRPNIDEVDEAWLDVKVEVKDWEVVNQNVVW